MYVSVGEGLCGCACVCAFVNVRRVRAVSGESSVGAILTSLLAQMSSARLQSDAAVADLALIYRNDPLLTSFPVPRMTVNQAVMSLKVRLPCVQ